MTKRKRTEETDSSLEDISYDTAQALIRRLMVQFNIDPTLLLNSGPSDSILFKFAVESALLTNQYR